MAKVNVSIGLTLRLTKNNDFQFIRPEIGIEDIDTKGDVELQLKQAVEALNKSWEVIKDQTNVKIVADLPHVAEEMELQIATKLETFKKQLDTITKDVSKLKLLLTEDK